MVFRWAKYLLLIFLVSCSTFENIFPPKITYKIDGVTNDGIRVEVFADGSRVVDKQLTFERRDRSKDYSVNYRPDSSGLYVIKIEDIGLAQNGTISSLTGSIIMVFGEQEIDITNDIEQPYEDFFNNKVQVSNQKRMQMAQVQTGIENNLLKSRYGIGVCENQNLMYGLFGQDTLEKGCVYKLDHIFIIQNQVEGFYSANIDPSYGTDFLQIVFKIKNKIASGTRINDKYVKYIGVKSFVTVLGAKTNLHVLEILDDL